MNGGQANVGRLLNNVFWTLEAIWNFEKVAERSRDSDGRSPDRRTTVKQSFLEVSSKDYRKQRSAAQLVKACRSAARSSAALQIVATSCTSMKKSAEQSSS